MFSFDNQIFSSGTGIDTTTRVFLRDYSNKTVGTSNKNFMSINQDTLRGIQGLLIFEINDREYCSDIKNISAILKLSEAYNGYSGRNDGKISFNNVTFKLLEIGAVLNNHPPSMSMNSRIILFETFGKQFGFLVDKIIEIITTDSIFLDTSLDLFPDSKEEFISGELIMQARKIFFIDFEKISKELDRLDVIIHDFNSLEKIKYFV